MNPYLRLIRPSNFVITLCSIALACVLAGGTAAQWMLIAAASLSGALIGAGGMVINDLFDIAIDRINKPDRPLASGVISPGAARMAYRALTASGLLLTLTLPVGAQLIAVIASVIIYVYSAVLKRTVLAGNIAVGLMTGLTFIYGGAAVGSVERGLLPAVFALLMNAGREIIKDMEDVEGDRKEGALTLPVKFGMKAGASAATAVLLLLVAASMAPVVLSIYTWKYLILVAAGMISVIGYCLYSLWTDQSTANLHRLSTILKYDMIVGLAAIYLG
ncbi:MAG: geranylgeranylglycerol-phosphate geranylgeranyltransferase [Acidobacteriota bacterium]